MGTRWFLILLGLTAVNCDISSVALWTNDQFNMVPDLRSVYCGDYEGLEGVSDTCKRHLNALCDNTDVLLTMLDASAKFPYSGLRYTSKWEYGIYDQCMTINYNYDGGRVLGEHCTVGLLIPDISANISDPSTYYRLGICRPYGCYASDLNNILLETVGLNMPLFQDRVCQTSEIYKDFTASDIVTLTIFAVFLCLMITSTIYDAWLYYSQKKSSHPLFCAFSVLSNGRKLLHISKHTTSKEQVEVFYGLRVISMIWIVAGHGFVGWQSVSVINYDTVTNWLDQRYAGYIATSHLAVDTFFYMSGFLLAFQYLKHKPKPFLTQVLSIPKMYIHRYLRITPALVMIYLVVISVFKHIGSGPIWNQQEYLAESCRKNWWSFFLYIQNYYNYDDLCLTQTWYLAVDMQMFILSPLMLIPLSFIVTLRGGLLISMLSLGIVNIIFTFLPMIIKLIFTEYTNEYDTHSRLINYFLGMMLAAFMRQTIDKPFLYMAKEHKRKVYNLIIWTIIILGMLATVICYQEEEMHGTYTTVTVFQSLMRPAWCIGLSWITYSCYHGYGGIVNWILCRPIFQVLGRLTYCIYLVHGSVVIYYVLATRVRWFFTDYVAFYYFCGHYIVSVILALFWTLAFESPLMIVEKFLMGGGRSRVERKPNTPQSTGISKAVQNESPRGVSRSDVEFGGVYRKSNEM